MSVRRVAVCLRSVHYSQAHVRDVAHRRRNLAGVAVHHTGDGYNLAERG
jgi:hypothetical protein